MSMANLTILQTLQIFAIYLGMTVVLPVIAFGNKLQRFSFPLRMMMYFSAGNFFIINLVLYLQLLHISYRPVLLLATALFYGYFIVKNQKLDPVGIFFYLLEMMDRRNTRVVGRKTFWRILAGKTKALRKKVGAWLLEYVICRIPEWIAGIGLVALIWYLFGQSFLVNLGYGASDIPVHNSWINELSKGYLFCDGIYPFGMHNVVYYIHTVFGMDTYVLLRIWGLVNTYCICGMLLAFLGWLCKKGTFLPFLGTYLYVSVAFIQGGLWGRFFSALPQEFGMIFILPAMAFLFAFFEERGDGVSEKEAKLLLFFFALNLALSISIHFYPAIITLILCLACGIGFVRVIFRKEYFFLIIKTGLFAFALAVLPMLIAFTGGTPFQGSMNWALSVMSNGGSGADNEQQRQIIEYELQDGETPVYGPNGVIVGVLKPGESLEDFVAEHEGEYNQYVDASETEEHKPNVVQRVWKSITGKVAATVDWVHNFPRRTCEVLKEFVINGEYTGAFRSNHFLWLWVIAFAESILFLFRQKSYGRICLSLSLGYGFMILLCSAGALHLPIIMDANRGRIFFYYMVPVVLIASVNGLLLFLEQFHHNGRITREVSILLGASVVCLTYAGNLVREPFGVSSFEYPGAITCLTNIIEDSKPHTYTIISANDETQMVDGVGFHYEIYSLLKHLALYQGSDYEAGAVDDLTTVDKGHLFIPTEDIYVFVEVIPLDYYGSYAGSGQRVSKEGASKTLPDVTGLSIYYTENRWICMSKLYYWMEAFQKLHPDAVSTYYSDKNFVCYRIHQNTYSLYDLCIDYGYNHCGERNITVND